MTEPRLWRRPMALLLLGCLGCGSSDAGAPTGGHDAAPPGYRYPLDDVLRLNQLQAKGTHNSYHVAPSSGVPDWMYTHAPLDVQLEEQGVRKVELDTSFDAGAGVFAVHHITILDEGTTCPTLVECLTVLEAWSDAHPRHHPLFVQIEPKDAVPDDAEAYFSRFENEIASVWPRDRLIAPDDVRGDAPTLREAVTAGGWPTLRQSRGKILFFVNDSGAWRDAYTRGGTSLEGRAMFAEADPEDPFAAVLILNDPTGDGQQRIREAVAAGFLVRTRADGVPLGDDPERRAEAALTSGAQVVSTDWPAPTDGGGYFFEIPGGTPSRCNPVVAPAECTSRDIEDPDSL